MLSWLSGSLLGEISLDTAEIGLSFTGWLFLAATITSVVLSFLVPRKLRAKGLF